MSSRFDGQPKKKSQHKKKPGSNINVVGARSILELSPGLIKEICDLVKMGTTLSVATAFKGISESTIRTWVLKARQEPDSIYGAFMKELTTAMAQVEIEHIGAIRVASAGRSKKYLMEPATDKKGNPLYEKDGSVAMRPVLDENKKPILLRSEVVPDWRASAWMLERKNPRNWALKDQRYNPAEDIFNNDPTAPTKDIITPEMHKREIEKAQKMLLDNMKLKELMARKDEK